MIRHARAFGRLTLRNSDRVGIAHLYFHSGKLAHIVSSSGGAEATLQDLRRWTHAALRFERGANVASVTITEREEQAFDELLLHLQRLGLAETLPMPRVVDGNVVR
jgi:hypothetical protein